MAHIRDWVILVYFEISPYHALCTALRGTGGTMKRTKVGGLRPQGGELENQSNDLPMR